VKEVEAIYEKKHGSRPEQMEFSFKYRQAVITKTGSCEGGAILGAPAHGPGLIFSEKKGASLH
jgi:hypothetical protein